MKPRATIPADVRFSKVDSSASPARFWIWKGARHQPCLDGCGEFAYHGPFATGRCFACAFARRRGIPRGAFTKRREAA